MTTNESPHEELWDYTPPVPDKVRQHPLPWDYTPPVPDKPHWVRKHPFAVIVAIAVLVLAGIGVGFSGGSSSGGVNTSSQSYQDGYTCGQAFGSGNYGGGGSDCAVSPNDSVSSNCSIAASILSNGDNPSEWIDGCTQGASDGEYQNAHPGS
jgi:hypothetical protein